MNLALPHLAACLPFSAEDQMIRVPQASWDFPSEGLWEARSVGKTCLVSVLRHQLGLGPERPLRNHLPAGVQAMVEVPNYCQRPATRVLAALEVGAHSQATWHLKLSADSSPELQMGTIPQHLLTTCGCRQKCSLRLLL